MSDGTPVGIDTAPQAIEFALHGSSRSRFEALQVTHCPRFLFYFPLFLSALRGLEPYLTGLPFGETEAHTDSLPTQCHLVSYDWALAKVVGQVGDLAPAPCRDDESARRQSGRRQHCRTATHRTECGRTAGDHRLRARR